MYIPTIHTNGTSEKELLNQLENAGHALMATLNALENATPNGRDYYPQGSYALAGAAKEHASRVSRVKLVFEEIRAIHAAILDAE